MFVLYMTIIPLMFLLFFFMMVPILAFSDHMNSRHIDRPSRFSNGVLFKSGIKHKDSLLIGMPFWLIFSILCLAFSVILTAILLIPFYLVSFCVFIRMAFWWSKNKNLKKAQNPEVIEMTSTDIENE